MKFLQIITFPLRFLFDAVFIPVYKKRLIFYISSLIPDGSKVLDVGCDNGYIAAQIMKKRGSIFFQGIDIRSNRRPMIPRKIYDGKKIPYKDNNFDIVTVLDVLHHTDDISSLLKEIKRVSRKCVIVKDHVKRSRFSYWLICFADFISNAPYGIRCTFNYPSAQQWNNYFDESGLKVVKKFDNLNLGFGIDETYNILVELEKK